MAKLKPKVGSRKQTRKIPKRVIYVQASFNSGSRKQTRKIPKRVIYVQASFNNTIVTFTNTKGQVSWSFGVRVDSRVHEKGHHSPPITCQLL